MNTSTKYTNFQSFYPFYLSQHQTPQCRAWHYLGSSLVIIMLIISLTTRHYGLLVTLPIIGYGCAWIGHFIYEKNRPATFQYPIYSLMGDWVMFWQWLRKNKTR